MRRLFLGFLLAAGLLLGPPIGRAEDSVFLTSVAPILARHCLDCHGPEEAEARLSLGTRDGVLFGSASGRVLVPGAATRSLLITLVQPGSKPHMPPEGQLTEAEIAALRDWIDQLTPDSLPRRDVAGSASHWAYQPLTRPIPPDVSQRDWSRTPIDAFLLARMEQKHVAPAPETSPATLCRRVFLDLTGLPPSPEEIEEFVQAAATDPTAYESLVDRLLASPHYGERWGRHWLDLARYADSGGYHEDIDRPYAWRYRDYVIQSLNDDKPYARFVAEQLAGDELDPDCEEAWIATGFCRNGPTNDDNMGEGLAREKYRLDLLDDVISTASVVFQGQTVGCARCHDHKFDPISQLNYYELLSVFDNSERVTMVVNETGQIVRQQPPKKGEPKPATSPPGIMALMTSSAKPRTTHLLWRGDVANPGPAVQPGVPAVLAPTPVSFPATASGRRAAWANWLVAPENPLTWRVAVNRLWQHHFHRGIVATPSNFGQTGARPTHPELLDWLASALIRHSGHAKPLHRLMVTSSAYRQDVHHSESQRVDPENALFARRVLHRMQAEALRDSILAVSGALNTAMSGPGVKPRVRPELLSASQRNKWPVVAQERSEHWRRSVYVYVKRQLPMPFLELFDTPDSAQTCERRDTSVVPTQALVLMNDEFTQEQALRFADRVLADAGTGRSAQVEHAVQIALGRAATSDEISGAVAFLEAQHAAHSATPETSPATAARRALADFCHVLFNANEFAFLP